jgi:hypothetical protein
MQFNQLESTPGLSKAGSKCERIFTAFQSAVVKEILWTSPFPFCKQLLDTATRECGTEETDEQTDDRACTPLQLKIRT